MIDPTFALEPDIPRNLRVARWFLFRMLSGLRQGSVTVREGAQSFILVMFRLNYAPTYILFRPRCIGGC